MQTVLFEALDIGFWIFVATVAAMLVGWRGQRLAVLMKMGGCRKEMHHLEPE